MLLNPFTPAMVRGFAMCFCALLSLGSSPASASDGVAPLAATPETGTQTGAPPAPLSLLNLRLQGVACIGTQETAYFTEASTGAVISLRVGDSLHGELKLVQITHADDFMRCQAVLAHGGRHYLLGIENFMETTPLSPLTRPSSSTKEEQPVEDPVVRVAVRPWVDPNQRG